jgi:hypothetical protein
MTKCSKQAALIDIAASDPKKIMLIFEQVLFSSDKNICLLTKQSPIH